MTRVSSEWTFFTKRVFPRLWFGIIAFIFLGAVAVVAADEAPPVILLPPVFMAAFGYVLMKHLVFDLADEVWDAGSELVVKNDGREARVPLRDVAHVSYAAFVNPPRVTLTLRHPSAMGSKITFAAPKTWRPFAKSPVIVGLVQRIEASRS
jgi:hypothetical protein